VILRRGAPSKPVEADARGGSRGARRRRGHAPWRAAWCSVLGFACLLSAGCGCGSRHPAGSNAEIEAVRKRLKQQAEEDRKEQERAKLRGAVEKKRKAQAKRKHDEEVARQRAEARKRATLATRRPTAGTRTSPPKLTKLPEEFADWKPDDYLAAKRQCNPRFPEAVAFLGENYPGSENAAKLLVRLVSTGSEARSGSGRSSAGQVEAIVAALAQNGTPAAWRALEGLLDGTIRSDDSEAAREAALAALAEQGGFTAEKILLEALLRSSGSSSEAVGDLARKFLDEYGPQTSERFRVALARQCFDRRLAGQKRAIVEEFLLKPVPKNLGAQVVIYRGAATAPAVRRQLQGAFLRMSSTAVGVLMGMPPEAAAPIRSRKVVSRPTGRSQTAYGSRGHRIALHREPVGPAVTADPELPARVAHHLWSAEMRSALAAELYQVDDLGEQAGLLALAGTMPVETMRADLYRTLRRNWQDGPEGVESTGIFDRIIIDPGLLVILKMMPRRDPEPSDESRQAPWLKRKRGSKPKYRPSVLANVEDMAETREMVGEVEQKWMRVCGQLVLRLSERFEAAALAQATSPGSGATSVRRTSGGDVRLPFTVHPGARVVTEYELTWPVDIADPACRGATSPMRVRHVRIEEQNRYVSVLGYYRHQIPSADEHLSAQGAWLDGLVSRPEVGTKISLDVLIDRDRIRGAPENEEEKLRVDVLMVEVQDPSRPQ